jgi:mannitol/fructose-specific phosphotransferase system IIA component (Ntr-type)
LRGILKEKGLRQEDPFEDTVLRSIVLDLKNEKVFEEVVDFAAYKLSKVIDHTEKEIKNLVLEGTRIGATPVTHGVALPHFRSEKVTKPQMVLVRCKAGVKIKLINPLTHKEEEEQIVTAIFFLISPESNPSQHLRVLAQIAGRVDDESFAAEWSAAKGEKEIKEALLHNEKFLSITVKENSKSEYMISQPLHSLNLPKGCLVALLQRDTQTLIPNGNSVISVGDKLTIIGEPKSIAKLRQDLFEETENLE